MQVHASADLPLCARGLGEALREFAAFAQSRLQPIDGSSLRIALAESGFRLAEAAARVLPAEVRSFGIGLGPMPGRELLTGPAFLERVAGNRPKRTYMQLATEDDVQRAIAWEALSRMAAAPASGRGVTLFVHLVGWRVREDAGSLRAEATFFRFQRGGRKMVWTWPCVSSRPACRSPRSKSPARAPGSCSECAWANR
jgi:hypothetical protein